MIQFELIAANTIHFTIDTSIYNDAVLSKVLYRLSDIYFIDRRSLNKQEQIVILEKKSDEFSLDEFDLLKSKINQDLIDFKTRDIVNQETKNIRDILYIKAFANGEDFEDFNLIEG